MCRDDVHVYYTGQIQTVIIDGMAVNYTVCQCGRSVVYGDKIMTMEAFVEATQKKDS